MGLNGERWDAVVLDPPKFIFTREDYGNYEGRQKYEDLNQLSIALVKPGGLFVTCSCSGLLSLEDFEQHVIKPLTGWAGGCSSSIGRGRVQTIRCSPIAWRAGIPQSSGQRSCSGTRKRFVSVCPWSPKALEASAIYQPDEVGLEGRAAGICANDLKPGSNSCHRPCRRGSCRLPP